MSVSARFWSQPRRVSGGTGKTAFRALHLALFRAYFVEARDISNPGVLLEIAGRIGLSVDAAREVIERRTFKDAVDADWKLSRQYGITGVPTFVAGRRGVVGAQPYETIEQLVRQAAEPR